MTKKTWVKENPKEKIKNKKENLRKNNLKKNSKKMSKWQKIRKTIFYLPNYLMWVKAWKKKPIAPRLMSFPKIAFSCCSFILVSIAFFTQFFKLNIKFEAKYDI